LGNAHRLVELGLEDAPVFRKEIRTAPTAGAGIGFTPAGNFLPGIVVFPVVEIGREDGPVPPFPGAVGDDGNSTSVLKFDLQLGEKLRVLAVKVALSFAKQVAAVPAVAEDGA